MKKIISFCFCFLFIISFVSSQKNSETKEAKTEVEVGAQRTVSDFSCAPRITMLDFELDEINNIGVAPWSFIFDGTGIEEAKTYSGFAFESTLDYFIVEVEVPGEEGEPIPGEEGQFFIEATLESFSEENSNVPIDEIEGMKLKRIGDSHTFRSKPIILVSDRDIVDDDFGDEDASNAPANFDNVDDIDLDPTIYAKINGVIRASYTNTILTTANVCGSTISPVPSNPNAALNEGNTETVMLKVFIAESNGVPYAEMGIVNSQLDAAFHLLAQSCIKLEYTIEPIDVGMLDLSNGLQIANSFETQEMIDLIEPVKALGTTDRKIDIIFINNFTGISDRGISLNDANANPPSYDPDHRRTCIISSENATYFTLAHEIGHILTNKGHFGLDYATGIDDQLIPFNLMKNGTSVSNGVFESKRLTDGQILWMHTATNIPR